MEKIREGADTSAISRRLMTIEHHLRVKGLEGTSGFLLSTPFTLLILAPASSQERKNVYDP